MLSKVLLLCLVGPVWQFDHIDGEEKAGRFGFSCLFRCVLSVIGLFDCVLSVTGCLPFLLV